MPTPVTASSLAPCPSPAGGQPGQVAFQQRPVDPGQGVHLGDGLGQEHAEAGQRRDVVDDGADRQPAGQPQPGPALDQGAQPGLGDPVEPQPVARVRLARVGGQAGQPFEPPDVAGVLHLPAGAVVQRLHDVAGEREERRVAACLRPGPVGPLLSRQVQQRAHPRVLDLPDRPVHHRCRQRDPGLIVAALDRVLQLQLEQRRQPAEVDAVPPGQQALLDERPRRRGAPASATGSDAPCRTCRDRSRSTASRTAARRPSVPSDRLPAQLAAQAAGSGCPLEAKTLRWRMHNPRPLLP